MALDKVVDSAVLDAGLKQIADAIREKGGTSNTLAFPTAMAEAIAAIQAGGGGGIKYSTGTYTPEATSTGTRETVSFEHQLNETPTLILFYRESHVTASTKSEITTIIAATEALINNHVSVNNLNGAFNGFAYTVTNVTFGGMGSSQRLGHVDKNKFVVASCWVAGNTYRWVAFAGVNIT